MMDGVQLSNVLNPSAVSINEPSNEFVNAEGLEMATDALSINEGSVMPAFQPQKTTMEAVIEKKVELEPEDPILPDHYYDHGNIPVFKPVRLS